MRRQTCIVKHALIYHRRISPPALSRCSYNAVQGIPTCLSPLMAAAREAWGFKGYVTSVRVAPKGLKGCGTSVRVVVLSFLHASDIVER